MRRWMQKVGGFSNAQLDPLFASENSRKYSQILGLFNKGSMGQSLLQHASPDSDGNFHTGLGKVKALNPQAPVAQKSADEVVFRRFQGEGVEFFLNRTSLNPRQIFDAHLLETTDLSPSRFHFSVGFRSRSSFESDGFKA